MKRILAGSFVLSLLACSDLDDIYTPPHVFSGNEVPPEVMAVPRLVKVAPPVDPNSDWPLVAEVPRHPDNFTPRPLIQETFQQMEDDRTNALAKKKEFDSEDAASSPSTSAAGPVVPMSSSVPNSTGAPTSVPPSTPTSATTTSTPPIPPVSDAPASELISVAPAVPNKD